MKTWIEYGIELKHYQRERFFWWKFNLTATPLLKKARRE